MKKFPINHYSNMVVVKTSKIIHTSRQLLGSKMAEVTTICKRTVVSATPVEPAGKGYPLSVLDKLMERSHLNIVYYLATPGNRVVGETTKKLRESLSETLTCFPMVTGRLVKNGDEGQWSVKCNDAGVRMVEATAKGNMEDWLKSVDRQQELKLVCWEEMFHNPYFWSTSYVQLTEFEGGGIAIGLSCIHLLADPICATMFIKAWADTTTAGKILDPPLFRPLPDRRRSGNKDPKHKPYAQLINYYKSSPGKKNWAQDTKYATVALAFEDATVRNCMAMARTTSGVSEQEGPSPFDALAGLFWVSVCRARGMRDGLMDVSICLDVRRVLGLENGFFGNCMIYNKIHAESLQEQGLASAAKAIGEMVTELNYDVVMDLIEWLECSDCRSAPTMNGRDLVCSNLEHVDPYLAEFEEGLGPVRVSYYVEPVTEPGQVLILRGPPSEGPLSRVVVVTLPEDEMVKLCEDNLIQCFSPTILLGATNILDQN